MPEIGLASGAFGAGDRAEVHAEVAVGDRRVERALEGVLHVGRRDLLAVDRRLLDGPVLDPLLDLDGDGLVVGGHGRRAIGEVRDGLRRVLGLVVVQRAMRGEDEHVVELEVRLAGILVLARLGGQELQRAALALVVGRDGVEEAVGRRRAAARRGGRAPGRLVVGAGADAERQRAGAGDRDRATASQAAVAGWDAVRHGDPPRGSGVENRAHRRRLRVERVLQSVADEVEREHGQHEGRAREDHVPPGSLEVGRGVGDHLAPARGRRLDADPEERQGGLEEDVLGQDERRVDDDRGHEVGEDLAEDDAPVRRAERARGLDELLLAQRQHLPADDPRHVGERGQRDHEDDHGQAGLDEPVDAALDRARRCEPDAQQQDREREQDVEPARDERVGPAAVEAGDQAEHGPGDDRDAGRDDRHRERHPRAVDGPAEDVLAGAGRRRTSARRWVRSTGRSPG